MSSYESRFVEELNDFLPAQRKFSTLFLPKHQNIMMNSGNAQAVSEFIGKDHIMRE